MIWLCSRVHPMLIDASGENPRGIMCLCTNTYCACLCVCVKLCPSTCTWRQHECGATNIQQVLCIFFCAVLHSINCSFRAVPGLRLISLCEQSPSAQTPTLPCPAWLNMAQQDLALLLGPKGKHASASQITDEEWYQMCKTQYIHKLANT